MQLNLTPETFRPTLMKRPQKNQKKTIAGPAQDRPILFGFAAQRRGSDGSIQIQMRWGRLSAAFVGLILFAWLGLSTALFLHFKYNKEYSEASFSNMLVLLPSVPFGGLDAHRVKMGNFHIARGLEEMKAGNYRDALRLLRLGVARAPGNLDGLRVLAEFYELGLKRPDVAAELLVKGLDRGGDADLDFIKQTLRLLLRHQMDERVQEIADRYLVPNSTDLTDRDRVIAFGAANANYLRGNYDRADDYLIEYGLINSLEGLLLSAQISWERGNRMAAISKLEASLRRFPDSGQLLMQLSTYHRQMEQYDQARRYAILRNVSDPLSAAPRLELLRIYHDTGEHERATKETQRMLRQFRDDEVALMGLTNFAADTGNIDLARRTYEEALENEYSIDSFALLLVEAHLVSGDYAGALNFAEELLKEKPNWLSERWAVFNSLRAVASFGIMRPDLGEIYLQDFINDPKNNPETYLAVARRFEKIDRFQQSRQVLAKAYERSPTNQKILTELIQAELHLGNTADLDRLLRRLLQMRRPQPELLVEAYRKLGSDRFIFTSDREGLLLQLSAMLRENAETQRLLSSEG